MSINYPSGVTAFGLSAEVLAEAVDMFMEGAARRVLGPGRQQYEKRDKDGHTFQSFEEMTPLELLQMAREEVQDLGVYAAMLDLRLARLQYAFAAHPAGDSR